MPAVEPGYAHTACGNARSRFIVLIDVHESLVIQVQRRWSMKACPNLDDVAVEGVRRLSRRQLLQEEGRLRVASSIFDDS